jgi:hypothetical protein
MFAYLPKIEKMKVAEERLFLGGKMRRVEAGNQAAKRDGARFRLGTRNSKGIFWVQVGAALKGLRWILFTPFKNMLFSFFRPILNKVERAGMVWYSQRERERLLKTGRPAAASERINI